MRNGRQTKIRRALLKALSVIPSDILLPDDDLRIEAARMVHPRPTTAELDAEIQAADAGRLIVGLPGEDAAKWKITDNGRVWLAENP